MKLLARMGEEPVLTTTPGSTPYIRKTNVDKHKEVMVTALCSEGPKFRRSYVQKVLCSEGPLFRRSYVQKVLCSEGSIFIRFYVQKVLCSETFVQKVLCLESVGDYLIGSEVK